MLLSSGGIRTQDLQDMKSKTLPGPYTIASASADTNATARASNVIFRKCLGRKILWSCNSRSSRLKSVRKFKQEENLFCVNRRVRFKSRQSSATSSGWLGPPDTFLNEA